ncbi:MAG: UDP-N-acetylmuramyl peptide synthase [Candidatus Dojkabacteria bacterium]|nr:MAG: UDP-N-acetylmuramyl peptide synthase [Candidatus Dojkabacteria bacterium]
MVVIYVLKLFIFLLRTFTSNSATALPGLILERFFPRIVKRIFNQFNKVILITGTNGKTTTTHMICYLLQQNGIKTITNPSGSNLIRGIISAIVDRMDIFGRVDAQVGVFEMEEGSIRKIIKFISPDIIVVTNIFRDQLDAYGEIDKTYKYIKEAVEGSNDPILILNGDDFRVADLKHYTRNTIIEIQVDHQYISQIKLEKNPFVEKTSNNTLNEGRLEKFLIKNVKVGRDLSVTFDLCGDVTNFLDNRIKVPGLHNAINAALAILTVRETLSFPNMNLNLEDFNPVFGRGEIIELKDKKNGINKNFQILLAKNPAGMNLNLHLLTHCPLQDAAVLILLNDKIADGRDVSWIWDVDFRLLKRFDPSDIYISGMRRWDLAVRLKYEGFTVKAENIFDNIEKALVQIRASKIYVLPTYTAMLEFRHAISKFTQVKAMWRSNG